MKFGLAVAVIVAVFVFLMLTVSNEGCLPWQERVSSSDGPFGDEKRVSRCDGSWHPFGSALLVHVRR